MLCFKHKNTIFLEKPAKYLATSKTMAQSEIAQYGPTCLTSLVSGSCTGSVGKTEIHLCEQEFIPFFIMLILVLRQKMFGQQIKKRKKENKELEKRNINVV